MTENDKNKDAAISDEKASASAGSDRLKRREFLKAAGMAAAATGTMASSIPTASANVPSQGYQPEDTLSVCR